MPYEPTTNFKDSDGVDLGKKLVTKDYLLSVYQTILENSPASGLIVTPELWAMGNGFFTGRLGTNTGTIRTPVGVFGGGTNWKQVSASTQHAAAIKTDGSLWVWGSAGDGRLGTNNTTPDRFTPVTTFVGGNDWKQVSCGYKHTAAIKTDGTLWVWGKNSDFAQLGINNNTDRSTPVTTFAGGNDWKQVDCINHTVAVKTDGSIWTWGYNAQGQLGINSNTTRSTPVTTFAGGNTWKQVSCGGEHAAAIKTDGTLWIWGSNNGGRLGVNDGGDFNDRRTPVTTFAGGTNWKHLDVASRTTAAIKTDGSLWTWGYNLSGECGVNDTAYRRTPVTTFAGGNNWKQVSGGNSEYFMAIKTDGTLWGWGNNSAEGQGGNLGTNDIVNKLTPVTTFAGGNNWKSVSAGGINTQAIQTIDYI